MATIDKVALDIAVVLGTTSMPVHQVLRLGRGAIIELDAGEEDDITILANNLPIARGTVVVNANRIAVEVREMLPRSQDNREPGRRAAPFLLVLMVRSGAQRRVSNHRAGQGSAPLRLPSRRPLSPANRFVTCSQPPGLVGQGDHHPIPAVVAELVDALA